MASVLSVPFFGVALLPTATVGATRLFNKANSTTAAGAALPVNVHTETVVVVE